MTKPGRAATALPERWHSLVQHSAAWLPGQPLDRVEEVRAFIRYTVDQAGGA